MSMWGKIAGAGMMIGGGALMFTPGGQLAGASLISGGASTFGAANAAGAAKKGAEQQQQAITGANQTLAGVDQRTQAGLAPYTQTGHAALGTLGSLMGLPALSGGGGSSGGGLGLGSAPAGMQEALGLRTKGPTSVAEVDADGNPRMAVPREDGPAARAAMATQSGYQAPQAGTLGYMAQGQTVMLRAPTGETRAVPVAQADALIARGAERVG